MNEVTVREGCGELMVGFSRMHRLLDLKLMAYLGGWWELRKQDDGTEIQVPSRTVANALTRLAAEGRIKVQQLSSRDRHLYHEKGTRPIHRDYVKHELRISETMVGFTLGMRELCNVQKRSPFADARLIQPWSITELTGVEIAVEEKKKNAPGKKKTITKVQPDRLPTFYLPTKGKMFGTLEEESGKIRDKSIQRHRMMFYQTWRQKFVFNSHGENPCGMTTFRVFYMCEDEWWLEELSEIARGLPEAPGSFFLFSSHERWNLNCPKELVTASVWQTATGERQPIVVE